MNLLKDTTFRSKIKAFLKKHKVKLLDVVLFGSVIKGKQKPKDIDILLLFKEREDLDIAHELNKALDEYTVHITSKTYSSLLSESFRAREAFLLEGYSLVKDKLIAECLGFFNTVMFKYDLQGKTKSERMRFYYALYGRAKEDKGVIEELGLIKFSDNLLICPVAKVEEVKGFLSQWGIAYKDFPMLLPTRLKHIL